MKIPPLYKKYHTDKDYTSIGLFRALRDSYKIEKVFYPGSYVHITPSLIYPDVSYADSSSGISSFFDEQSTLDFIRRQKEYAEEATIRFYHQNYTKPFTTLGQEFDMVISQYAGFVGQAVKPYLKEGGILVCNNSHGDASMSHLDEDYTLIAVYRRYSDNKFTISDRNLEQYFVPKSGAHPTKEELLTSNRGVGYTKTPSGYIFKKKQRVI